MLKTKDGYEVAEGMWVSDHKGTYEIVKIDYERQQVEVNEIEYIENDDYRVTDTYYRTFHDMKDCYYN